MKKYSHKIAFIIAALSLLLLFEFPLWRISLGIPQYPKEITVHIWINKIVNGTKKAIEIINVLNHNIGIKDIKPDSIPELKYFPWIVMAVVITGLIVSFFGNRKTKIFWLACLFVLSLLALLDFYLWLYHYGHDLDPGAPLTINGSSFQPPLIGVKTIINFKVASWPMTGIIFPLISFIFGILSIRIEKNQ